jgi:hypothetical protein
VALLDKQLGSALADAAVGACDRDLKGTAARQQASQQQVHRANENIEACVRRSWLDAMRTVAGVAREHRDLVTQS